MNEIPREKLREIVAKNGEAILQDPDRCEGLLKDHCAPHRREISALVGAMEERVPLELRSSWQTAMTPEAMRARLVQRLQDHRGLAPDVADWAVDAWSYALGVNLNRKSDPVPEELDDMSPVDTEKVIPSDIERKRSSQSKEKLRNPESKEGAVATSAEGWSGKKKAGVAAFVVLVLAIAGAKLWPHNDDTCRVGSTDPKCEAKKEDPVKKDDTDKKDEKKDQVDQKNAAVLAQLQAAAAANIPIRVRVDQKIDSGTAVRGNEFSATVQSAVVVNGKEIIPQGTPAIVRVTSVDKAGHIKGVPEVGVSLVQLSMNGTPYPVSTGSFVVRGKSRGKNTAKKTAIGAGIGAAIGGIFKKGKGALGGAGAGAGTALGYQALTDAEPAVIPAEMVVSFKIKQQASTTNQ